MGNRDVDLTAAQLTLAGAMITVPVIVLTPTKLITGDVPRMMLKAGLWSMTFSLVIPLPSLVTAIGLVFLPVM